MIKYIFQITGAVAATQRNGEAAAGTAGAGTGRGPTSATTEARTSGGSSSATTARRRARLRTSPSRKGDHSPFFNLYRKHYVPKCCYVVLTSYLQYYILVTISCCWLVFPVVQTASVLCCSGDTTFPCSSALHQHLQHSFLILGCTFLNTAAFFHHLWWTSS